MGETTTIPLSKETRDLLKKFGQKGETYDALIRRLLDMAEQIEFARKQKRILAEEEFVPIDQVWDSTVPNCSFSAEFVESQAEKESQRGSDESCSQSLSK